MKPHALRSFLALFLAAAISVSQIPVNVLSVSILSPDEIMSIPEESVPAASNPGSTEPSPSELLPSEPEFSEPDASEPNPSEPLPSEPVPSEPVPSEPASSEPVPSEPLPSEPVPSEPAPSEPAPSEPALSEPVPPETLSSDYEMEGMQDAPEVPGPGLYFGQLHAHTALSGGAGTVQEAFSYAAQVRGLDFFAITEHSHSLCNQDSATLTSDASGYSTDWAAGKAAAAAVTSSSFVGIYGYEMSWPSQMKIGHIATFGTPGFQSWKQGAYRDYDGALEAYYRALASVPGAVSQFNHPGSHYGSFCDFAYSEAADRAVALLEIHSGGQETYDAYIQALDLGWHLAPTANQANYGSHWGDASSVRTVVYAQSLTEEDILDALGNCRAYATEDADLEILYSMDGHFMGSRLDRRHIGGTADLCVTLFDPTDSSVGTVEVITNGGQSIAQQTLNSASGTLAFSLKPESGYYFLRITQPDGDTAVTAPIWVDAEEDLGISGLTCETAVPVQNEAVVLALDLHNRESVDFSVDCLTVFADGNPVFTDSLTQIAANSSLSRSLAFSCGCIGLTRITVKLTGTLEGSPRSYETSIDLNFHRSQEVTSILVDGSHGNAGLDQLEILREMAREEHVSLSVVPDAVSVKALEDTRFFLITAPSEPFSQTFLAAVQEYAQYGGSLVVCGQADSEDGGFPSAAELNRLLSLIGSSMRIQDDTAWDAADNGGEGSQLYASRFNRQLDWCGAISTGQVYRASPGCTIDPGRGTWMVKGGPFSDSMDGDSDGLGGSVPADVTLLACESLPGGGTVFAAGSLFFGDRNLEEPRNIWDEPFANRTLAAALLEIGGEAIPLCTVQEARAGTKNELFRIRGYVTAGTANPCNAFPDTLYLQDDTGGIAVTPFPAESIRQGTALEVTGFAGIQNGNRILKTSSWEVLDVPLYQYEPLTDSWDTLLNPSLSGGSLVEVEGICLEIYCREDGTLAGCLLADENGNQAKISIEDYIRNGSDGGNDLHKRIRRGRTVRAAGLLHIDEYGDTVLRVRNCEEVVWVPPRWYLNPRTGDRILPGAIGALTLSLSGLILLNKRKYP